MTCEHVVLSIHYAPSVCARENYICRRDTCMYITKAEQSSWPTIQPTTNVLIYVEKTKQKHFEEDAGHFDSCC